MRELSTGENAFFVMPPQELLPEFKSSTITCRKIAFMSYTNHQIIVQLIGYQFTN